jgi:hypothetical protein
MTRKMSLLNLNNDDTTINYLPAYVGSIQRDGMESHIFDVGEYDQTINKENQKMYHKQKLNPQTKHEKTLYKLLGGNRSTTMFNFVGSKTEVTPIPVSMLTLMAINNNQQIEEVVNEDESSQDSDIDDDPQEYDIIQDIESLQVSDKLEEQKLDN